MDFISNRRRKLRQRSSDSLEESMSIQIKRRPGTKKEPMGVGGDTLVRNPGVPVYSSFLKQQAAASASSDEIKISSDFGIRSVVNVRKKELQKLGYNDLLQWLSDPNNVYIGRDMTRYVPGAVGSKWQNPFKVKNESERAVRIQMYKDHVMSKPELYGALEELKGKNVGCWCHPDPCHGHILQQMLQEKMQKQKE